MENQISGELIRERRSETVPHLNYGRRIWIRIRPTLLLLFIIYLTSLIAGASIYNSIFLVIVFCICIIVISKYARIYLIKIESNNDTLSVTYLDKNKLKTEQINLKTANILMSEEPAKTKGYFVLDVLDGKKLTLKQYELGYWTKEKMKLLVDTFKC
jgi:uncharacterized ion transporter superfamily protein YfcC